MLHGASGLSKELIKVQLFIKYKCLEFIGYFEGFVNNLRTKHVLMLYN